MDSESESNQEITLGKQWCKSKAQMQKRTELQSFVDAGNTHFTFDSSERCRLWLGQAAGMDKLCYEPPQEVMQIQRTNSRFRGQVSLSLCPPEALHGTCKLSVCSLNDTHFVLLGGSEWDTELIKLSVDGSDLQMRVYGEKCFTLKIRRSFVYISVESQEARDRWLSALSEKGVAIVGWDTSLRCCQPSSSLASTSPGHSLRRTLNLVIWLS